MRILPFDTYEGACIWVAAIFKKQLEEKPDSVLCLPTGSTPVGVYDHICKMNMRRATTFNMDEYVGLSPDHPQSYQYEMYENLFERMRPEHRPVSHFLDGNIINTDNECIAYHTSIQVAGGFDLLLGGIGEDAHIAFNKPGSCINNKCRKVTLNESTRKVNARFFNSIDDVPKSALTIGMQEIMGAKKIIIMAFGEKKADALMSLATPGQKTPLRLLAQHPNCTLVCDNAAVKKLRKAKKLMFGCGAKIIFSPHPDDDVIGCGGIMQTMLDLNIAYCTSGLTTAKKEIRQWESELAVGMLDPLATLEFMDLPFYYATGREITQADINAVTALLDKIAPDTIYVCDDKDPNGTHRKCREIISRSAPKKKPFVFLYRGAWGRIVDSAIAYPLYHDQVMKKVSAVLAHSSQNPPLVHHGDKTPFHQRAYENCISEGETGYEEQFEACDWDYFVRYAQCGVAPPQTTQLAAEERGIVS